MDIVFRNYSGSELNTETKGLEEFRELAEKSAKIFSSRRQIITGYRATDDQIECKSIMKAYLRSICQTE
jgi:hypothetical protein